MADSDMQVERAAAPSGAAGCEKEGKARAVRLGLSRSWEAATWSREADHVPMIPGLAGNVLRE